MLHWREEGQPIRNGFNFYKLNDKTSSGFSIRLGRFIANVRYSKKAKKWFVNKGTVSKLTVNQIIDKLEK